MKEAYKIEKDIPIPPPQEHHPRRLRGEFHYPIREMEIGDSFLVTDPGKSIRLIVYSIGRKTGMKMVTRKQVDGSMRIWRTK